jgi:hypothetical protein
VYLDKPPAEVVAKMARKHRKDDEQVMDASRNGSMADATPDAESSGGAGAGRLLLLLLLAALLAMVLSKDVRAKALDMLFGAEEEFDYASTTMPATDAPVGAGAS